MLNLPANRENYSQDYRIYSVRDFQTAVNITELFLTEGVSLEISGIHSNE